MGEPQHDDPLDFSRRLRIASTQTRLRMIESQFVLAFTLCQTAATELHYGHKRDAAQLVTKLRRAYDSLRQRLSEPQHVSRESLPGFLYQLEQLESRIHEIESRLEL